MDGRLTRVRIYNLILAIKSITRQGGVSQKSIELFEDNQSLCVKVFPKGNVLGFQLGLTKPFSKLEYGIETLKRYIKTKILTRSNLDFVDIIGSINKF